MECREKITKILNIILIAILSMFLVSFVFFRIFPRWTEDKIFKEHDEIVKDQDEIVKEHEKNLEERIKNFKENQEMFDTLVNNLYLSEDEIIIKYSNGNISYLVNRKEKKLSEEQYSFYNKLFSSFECERVWLYTNSDGSKVLDILIGSEDGHIDSIIYNEDNGENSIYEFAPGWYYETLWYT